jgi:ABC-type nitrate/sulfonate/bicarbonate transport system substrate-binding protein
LIGGLVTPYVGWMVTINPTFLGPVEKKFHTQIITDSYGSSNAGLAAFYGGQEQMELVTWAAGVPIPTSNGRPGLLGVFQESNGSGVAIVAAQKYKASIGTNAAGFASKTWCATIPSGTSYSALTGYASTNGLNINNINKLYIGSTAGYLPTMQSGQCDVTGMDAGSAANAVIQGIGYILANTNDPKTNESLFSQTVPQLGIAMVSTSTFTHQYPALTQALIQAQIKANNFILANIDNPNKIYTMLPSDFTQANPVGLFVQQWSLTAPAFVTNGLFSPQQVAATVSTQKAQGLISSSPGLPPLDQLNTNTYTLSAYNALGLPRPQANGLAKGTYNNSPSSSTTNSASSTSSTS